MRPSNAVGGCMILVFSSWSIIIRYPVVDDAPRSATGLGIDMVVYPVVYMGLVIHLPAQAILFFPHI